MATETPLEADTETRLLDADPRLSRDPADYRPTIHFRERFYDQYDEFNRHLDGEIVNRCIREGEITRSRPSVYYFRETVGGVTYRLVVDVREGLVLSGHPLSINTDAARTSGRWSASQIDDILHYLRSQ